MPLLVLIITINEHEKSGPRMAFKLPTLIKIDAIKRIVAWAFGEGMDMGINLGRSQFGSACLRGDKPPK